jgi:hypothetical protein
MPTFRNFRLLTAGAALALTLPSCSQPADNDPGADATTNDPVAEPILAQSPVLNRGALLLAIAEAASAFSAGIDDSKAQRELDGRQFSVRLPFACAGPLTGDADAPMKMTLRSDSKVLEVRAVPTIGPNDVAMERDEQGEDNPIRAIEGFWIEWPWMMAEQCPPSAQLPPTDPFMTMRAAGKVDDLPPAPPEPERTAGIAQFFTATDSRLASRSGRDYHRVVPLAEGVAAPKGLYLMLEGRLRTWPDGKVIRCSASQHGGRPPCIAGSTIDRVAIERADDLSVIGEWTAN